MAGTTWGGAIQYIHYNLNYTKLFPSYISVIYPLFQYVITLCRTQSDGTSLIFY